MSTTIEWTQRPGTKGETWNPVVGCTKVSAGCKFCYAKRIHDNRHKAYTEGKLQKTPQYAKPFEHVQLMHARLTTPLGWKQPRTVFVNSVSDLFHEDVPFDFIDRVFAIMALTPQHTYQILTKRPERMAEYTNAAPEGEDPADYRPGAGMLYRIEQQLRTIDSWLGPDLHLTEDQWSFCENFDGQHLPLPNVWLGTSVENQAAADARIPHLLRCPAAVRFLSCEPLLGPVDLKNITGGGSRYQVLEPVPGHRPRIDWVITGGESGPGARPMHPDWARSLRDQCAAAEVPFFFKQWGAWKPTPHPARYMSGMAGKLLPMTVVHSTDRKRIGAQCFEAMPSVCTSPDRIVMVDMMDRAGKHASGNRLDGHQHLAYPTV